MRMRRYKCLDCEPGCKFKARKGIQPEKIIIDMLGFCSDSNWVEVKKNSIKEECKNMDEIEHVDDERKKFNKVIKYKWAVNNNGEIEREKDGFYETLEEFKKNHVCHFDHYKRLDYTRTAFDV